MEAGDRRRRDLIPAAMNADELCQGLAERRASRVDCVEALRNNYVMPWHLRPRDRTQCAGRNTDILHLRKMDDIRLIGKAREVSRSFAGFLILVLSYLEPGDSQRSILA